MIGITIRPYVGIGDGLQFTSLPENFFRSTGRKLVDITRPWFFDHNPYVDRTDEAPKKSIELWNFPFQYEFPKPLSGTDVYSSNAEIWTSTISEQFGLRIESTLIRPRLYRFEDFPFSERKVIAFHPFGRSHGALPNHVIDHIIKKYRKSNLVQVGLPDDPDLGIPRICTKNLWELAEFVSKCRMFIGVDSGPSWIAACYPDVVLKKIRVRDPHGEKPMKKWVPLERANIHSYWDDRAFMVYNTWEDDVAHTMSYRKL